MPETRPATLLKKESLTQVFTCEFCEISKNTFFTELLWATASEQKYLNSKIESTIPKTKETPLEALMQPNTTKIQIIPFITLYDPNNLRLFPIIKQTVQCSTFFRRRDLLTITDC